MTRVVFKAQLGDGPVQEVGGYEFLPDEWEDYMRQYDSPEDWLQSAGADWAYDAVHTDCLKYWAEFE